MEHYVYLYRNLAADPIYVGYGKKAKRSMSHVSPSGHNPDLTRELAKGYTLEISGPFGNELTARAVETALISALSRTTVLTNKNRGPTKWRFRPLGVPAKFVDRLDLPALTRKDLASVAASTNGIIFVIINDKDFEDGRQGDPLTNLPTDADLAKRMDRWWQLRLHADKWGSNSNQSPGLLVAVGGTPSYRLIIGSLFIDKKKWSHSLNNVLPHGLLIVPHSTRLCNLDAMKIRGRRLDASTNLKFGSLRHQSFILHDDKGNHVGGGNKTLIK
jgi:hypothetical protein